MSKMNSKAISLLERLAHFYHPDQAKPLLLDIAAIFGEQLERAEIDLYRVLRAHHVETANNEGDNRYIAELNQRSDLAKLFALYTDALGGTSQLTHVQTTFHLRSFDAERLLTTLFPAENTENDNAFLAYIRQTVKKQHPKQWQLVTRYLTDYCYFKPEDISVSFLMDLVLNKTPPISRYIVSRLSAKSKDLLFNHYAGEAQPNPALLNALSEDINQYILNDIAFFKKNYTTYFKPKQASIPRTTQQLYHTIYADFLQQHYEKISDPRQCSTALKQLNTDKLEINQENNDNLIRLNRSLFNIAYHNKGFKPLTIPSINALKKALVIIFNALLQDETIEALIQPLLSAPEKQQLATIKEESSTDQYQRHLLETLFPLEIKKHYLPYRQRLLEILQVLKRGASTKQGILDIVTANLGIVGDDKMAQHAKNLIAIDEYDPQIVIFFAERVCLKQTFTVKNTTRIAKQPDIKITVLARDKSKNNFEQLTHFRLMDGDKALIVFNGKLSEKDVLSVTGSKVLLNGLVVAKEKVSIDIPTLAAGEQRRLSFVADVHQPRGNNTFCQLDSDCFNDSVFAPTAALLMIEIGSYEYTPGVFRITIPWHIKGFTDQFANTEDHPRHQILALVNGVKAAGIKAEVAYQQSFSEQQQHIGRLGIQCNGELLTEQHPLNDALVSMQLSDYPNQEHQSLKDEIKVKGCFDYTHFNSLNTFA